jgi:nucleoside-diphosphate-sugar epimerase
MLNVLVTGAGGFIGSALVRELHSPANAGAIQVIAPTRAVQDLLEPLAPAMFGERVDVLVHAAASRARYRQDVSCWPDEVAINVESTSRLYDAARRNGVRAIIQLSSISVFHPNLDAEGTISEESPMVTAPADAYALSKRWAEEMAVSLRSYFDAIAIVRPAMTYGESQHDGVACARLGHAIRAREPQVLAKPRGHRTAPVYIDDVIDVIVRLIHSPQNTDVNVAGPEAMFQHDIVCDIARHLETAPVVGVSESEQSKSYAPTTVRVDQLLCARSQNSNNSNDGNVECASASVCPVSRK